MRLETALNVVDTPVFIVDAYRQVVFVNRGCELLTGWDAQEVVGRSCSLASDGDTSHVESVTGALCPPQEVLDGHVVQTPRFFIHKLSRKSTTLLVSFFPLEEASEGGVSFVLGVVTGLVTGVERKTQTEARSVLNEVHAELAALRHQLRQRFGTDSLLGRCPEMRRVSAQVAAAQQMLAIVQFCGPPGSGKEHAARAIHYGGALGQRAFVPLDCRSLPAAELRSALHRMVETDWSEVSSVGALHPGCVYFDHVDALPRELQQRIVDLLESTQAPAFRQRVRLMSGSEKNLLTLRDQEVLLDSFYLAMTEMSIELPTLKSRGDDLMMLAQHFLELQNRRQAKQISGFTAEVLTAFAEYNWPENVEELGQVVTDCHKAARAGAIQLDQLPLRFRAGLDAQSLSPASAHEIEPLDRLLQRVEREHIKLALQRAGDNKAKAAQLLGINRPALYRRMETLGLADEIS